MIAYFLLFISSLLVGVLVCNGIWIATGGETKDMVDGSKYDTDKMVLYWLYKLVANPTKKFFEYSPSKLDELIKYLRSKDNYFDTCIGVNSKILFAEGDSADYAYTQILIEKYLDIDCVDMVVLYDENAIKIREYYWQVNFFSKPIVACIKCFSSFWGSITFWLMVYLFNHENLLNYIDYNVILPMWILVVVCMPPLNVLLEKRTRDEH